MTHVGLTLSPLDTLFFRDGRPFDAADRAVGTLPTPQPLAGALRTALLGGEDGFEFRNFSRAVRDGRDISSALKSGGLTSPWYEDAQFNGPFLAIQSGDDTPPIPLLPTPLNVRRKLNGGTGLGQWSRAKPIDSLPGWTPELEQLQPLWHSDSDAEYPGGFLTLPAINQYLRNDCSTISDDDWFQSKDLCKADVRTGIEVDPNTFTAADSKIYGISLLALTSKLDRRWHAGRKYHGQRVILYGELLADADEQTLTDRLTGPIPLGGEGHYVNSQQSNVVEWPKPTTSEQEFWLLASPALLPHQRKSPGWLPSGIPAEKTFAASAGQPLPVSGWDALRRGPRATRFAVPAGSVFYTKGLATLPGNSVCTESEDVRQGWGFALSGDWK